MSGRRVIVAGCGAIAPSWLEPALARDDLTIVALADPMVANTQGLARRFDLTCPWFVILEDAVRGVEADLVFNLTPPAGHHGVTLAGLRAGCDVLTEKPLASGVDEGIEVVEAARDVGRRVSVMQNRRFSRPLRDLRAGIAQGLVGQVGMIAVDFFLGPHYGGFRETMPSPLLLDMAIHTFDGARFLSGATPVAATCLEIDPPGSWFEGAAAAVCTFEMADGSIISYRGSWASVGHPTSWGASWRISGSRGTALWDGEGEPRYQVLAGGDGFVHPVEDVTGPSGWQGRDGHAGCLDEMLTALDEGRPAETDAGDHLWSLAMVSAAIESARRGGARVKIGPDRRVS